MHESPVRAWKFGWLLGAALLGAVVLVTMRFTEAEEFVRVAERAHPGWLGVAVLLQAATYLAESRMWRAVARAGHSDVPMGRAYGLSIAKLFVDQTLPSGGLSGTVVYVRGLERAGVAREVALAGVAVTTFGYYASYSLCLGAAMALIAGSGVSDAVKGAGVSFLLVSTAFAILVVLLSGAEPGRISRWCGRVPVLGRGIELLHQADRAVARSPRLLASAVGWQMIIVFLDAGTVWLAMRALGVVADVQAVFAAYMFSSLFRTISIVPGGLGAFEAASVLMLRHLGIQVPAALAGTLIYRGLSFWLPMIPGFLCARGLAGGSRPSS